MPHCVGGNENTLDTSLQFTTSLPEAPSAALADGHAPSVIGDSVVVNSFFNISANFSLQEGTSNVTFVLGEAPSVVFVIRLSYS